MKTIHPQQHKNRVAASFGAKVANYARNALIQRKLLEKVCSQILCRPPAPNTRWLDLGCGDGMLEQMLAEQGICRSIIGLDIAPDSLKYCLAHSPSGAQWLQGDVDRLPFKPNTFDGIIAASVLQWSHQVDETLRHIPELLVDGGVFVFSLFIEGAFRELAEMRKRNNLSPAVSLPRLEDISNALSAGNCRPVVVERYDETIFFPSSRALLRHLSAIGSTSVGSHMSRRTLEQFCLDFDACFGTDKGVPLSYAAIYGFAEKGGSHG